MTRYIVQKLFSLILVQLGISVIVFYMIRLVPGDVVDFIYGLYMGSVIASSYVIMNTLADIGYAVIDPRVRYD